MKLVENLNKIYYIRKLYKCGDTTSTFVRIKTKKGSTLYKTSKTLAMFFESPEIAQKYVKTDGEQIRELKLGEDVLLKRNKENPDILEYYEI